MSPSPYNRRTERPQDVKLQDIALREEKVTPARIIILGGMHGLAIIGLFHASWQGLIALLIGHFLTGCFGITIGYHRLISHASFRCRKLFYNACALFGALALQGGPLTWAAYHRSHHAQTDKLGDPHSSKRGFVWSHFLWMLYGRPNGFRFSRKSRFLKDINEDKWLQILEKHYLSLNIAVFFLFFLIFLERQDVILWAFPVRIVFYWHCTWLVNSYAHSHKGTALSAKNSAILSILTYGEGWHRNHHLSPTSATFKREWYQFDFAYCLLRILSCLKIVELKREAAEAKGA